MSTRLASSTTLAARLLLAAALTGGGAPVTLAQAGTIVMNGGLPDHLGGHEADAMGEYYSIATEKISLTTALTFNQLDWWGAYAWGGTPSVLDNFAISIDSDAGVIPGALIASRSMSPFNVSFTGHQISFGDPTTRSNEYAYSATVPNVTLGPGTYHLGLERFGGFLTYTAPE